MTLQRQVGFRVRLAGLHFLGGLAQIRENKVFGAGQGDQLDALEFIAGDGGLGQLAVIADLGDEAADLVMLVDGFHQGFVRGIYAEMLLEGVEHVGLELLFVMLQRCFRSS
jgi:hypothetical protein